MSPPVPISARPFAERAAERAEIENEARMGWRFVVEEFRASETGWGGYANIGQYTGSPVLLRHGQRELDRPRHETALELLDDRA